MPPLPPGVRAAAPGAAGRDGGGKSISKNWRKNPTKTNPVFLEAGRGRGVQLALPECPPDAAEGFLVANRRLSPKTSAAGGNPGRVLLERFSLLGGVRQNLKSTPKTR